MRARNRGKIVAHQRRAQLLGERGLFRRPHRRADAAQIGIHHAPQHVVGQDAVIAADDFKIDLGPGAECSTLRRLLDALEHRRNHARIGMAHDVIGFGKFRHDVGRRAAVGDDVMDARLLRHVLAQIIDHHVHHFDAVERGAAAVWRGGGVRRLAVEAKLGADIGEVLILRRRIRIAGMPVERDVYVFEQSRLHHVVLAAAAFFGRRAIDAQLTLGAGLFQPFLHRDCGGDRARAEQIVAAGVTGDHPWNRLAFRRRGLREPRQRIHFGENGDHRAILASCARDE